MNQRPSPTHSAAIRMRSAFRPSSRYAKALALLADERGRRHFQVVEEQLRRRVIHHRADRPDRQAVADGLRACRRAGSTARRRASSPDRSASCGRRAAAGRSAPRARSRPSARGRRTCRPCASAIVFICVVSEPVVGSLTPNACRRSSPLAIFGRNSRFCASEPCRSSVPIVYICAWHAPALAPLRLISSMMIDASAMPRPEPPNSSGNERREIAGVGQRLDERVGIRPRARRARASTRRETTGRARGRRRADPDGSRRSDVGHERNDIGVPWPPCGRRCRSSSSSGCARVGTRALFGVPGGGGNLDLIEAARGAGLPFVLTSTETGGAIAAHGAGGGHRPARRVSDDARAGRGVGRERRRVRVSRARADRRVHGQQSGRRERDVRASADRSARAVRAGHEVVGSADRARRALEVDRAGVLRRSWACRRVRCISIVRATSKQASAASDRSAAGAARCETCPRSDRELLAKRFWRARASRS